MQYACVYIHKGIFYIATQSKAKNMFYFIDGACTVLPASVDDGELGSAIDRHLSRSRVEVEHDIRERNMSIASASGQRSMAAFEKTAEYRRVHRDQAIVIEKWTREKGQGHTFDGVSLIQVPKTSSHEQIGAALRDTLPAE
jgi:hypothetical protein